MDSAINNLILEGLYLMLIGMSVVVGFLSILVLLLVILRKTLGEETTKDKQILTAIIGAAVHRYKYQKDHNH